MQMMIFILTSLTIYLIMAATPGESGITYSTPKRERQTNNSQPLLVFKTMLRFLKSFFFPSLIQKITIVTIKVIIYWLVKGD